MQWITFVSKRDPNDDFPKGSYISIENGKGVIYATSIDDYVFGGKDIQSFVFANETPDVHIGSDTHIGMRFMIEFNDGKKQRLTLSLQNLTVLKKLSGCNHRKRRYWADGPVPAFVIPLLSRYIRFLLPCFGYYSSTEPIPFGHWLSAFP